MRIDELTVEVRDETLTRVGQLVGADLVGAKFILRFNNPGSWSVSVANDSAVGQLLRTPGYGLIVTGPEGVLLSGPTMSAKLTQTEDNPEGTWLIEGVDDAVILSDRLAYPYPSEADVTAQAEAYDTRTGDAETVLKGYVNANLVSGPAVRQVANLTVATNQNRGESVLGSARFDILQELFFSIAQTGGLGYTIVQDGDELVFDVYEPADVSALVRMDVDNGLLTSSDYLYSAPAVTRAIVGGAGESVERLFYEGTTADSEGAETVWARRVERFIDSRGGQATADFEQSAYEALVDAGKTQVEMSVVPSDSDTMRFGYDWSLGDTVTVVANDIEATAVVSEVGIALDSDGVYIAATVGQPVPSTFEAKLVATTTDHETRIGNLERNTTGFGVSTVFAVSGGTDGTQPTFSGEVFTSSYTRFGNMVHFAHVVDFTNITSFGTGQYYMTLPYNAAHSYILRDGCLHDSYPGGTQYHISGHVEAGSNELWLYSSDKVASGVQDVAFTSSFPITLTTSGRFHIAGSYEIEV